MDFNEYQNKARQTAQYPDQGGAGGFSYVALGLNGEAGEVAEHAKKVLRDDQGVVSPDRREKIKKELGDVLWYVSNCCSELGLSMGDVAQGNIDKLFDRKDRGVIQGDGDER